MPWSDNRFDAVAFDPPYVAMGGRETSTIDLFDRFGLVDAPKTPRLLQDVIDAGIDECFRVVKPGGFVLVKCKDYICAGKYWPGVFHTTTRALAFGVMVDRFEMIANGVPRPLTNRRAVNAGPFRQVHARRNHSTLLVFRKGRK